MPSSVLLSAPLQPELEAALVARHGAVRVPPPGDPGRLAALQEVADDARVLVTTARHRVGADDLDALPGLGAVVSFGVGTDVLDVAAARERGVGVANTPDVLTDAVADLAVGLVIDTLRGTVAADRHVRAGRWATDGPPPPARQVSGRKVGIVGLGRIGRAVASRLRGFSCPVAYHTRRPGPAVEHAWLPSVGDLADWADVLVLTAPGGPVPLVGADELRRLGADGVLVNVGRGTVVDQDALVAALVEGTIAGAGLDVLVDEPRVPDVLLGLDQVVLTPHIGSATVETRSAMRELVLENVATFLAEGRLVTPVPAR